MVNTSYCVLSYTYTLKNTVYFLIYSGSFNLTFRPVTDEQTASDKYEHTVYRHSCGLNKTSKVTRDPSCWTSFSVLKEDLDSTLL